MYVNWEEVREFVDDMEEAFDVERVLIENDSAGNMVVTVVINDGEFWYVGLKDIVDTDDWGVDLRSGHLAIWKRFLRG